MDSKTNKNTDKKLTAVIRISGMVKVRKEISEALNRLRLRRKYSCVLIDTDSTKDLLKRVKHYVAYGEIDKESLIKLLNSRAEPDLKSCNNKSERDKLNKSVRDKLSKDGEKIADELYKGKKLSEFGLKQFFRLHPPRGGIMSKRQYPIGVLGYNGKNINKLIERML